MDVKVLKRLAADILGVGVNRVRIKPLEGELAERIATITTREDVRSLIKEGVVYALPKKGRRKKEAKKRKAKRGPGSKKGKKYSRKSKKEIWLERIRALRKLLKKLKEEGKIDTSVYRDLYLKVKGNQFKGKKSLLQYLESEGLLR